MSDVWIVFLAALGTAVATGFGALPFLFIRDMGARAVGLSNAAAAGLMMAASFGLLFEGAHLNPLTLVLGILLGLGAIMLSDRALSRAADVELGDLEGGGGARALMILGVMTAHSFAEGVGVGVSFAGEEGLGTYISSAIALHNIPEGLAISLVLIPRGTPVWKAALWSIFTSLPQPLMAVPAYLFVDLFQPLLPVGLGLAAGAMIWMVFAEMLPDALEKKVSGGALGAAVTLAFAAMLAFQTLVLGG